MTSCPLCDTSHQVPCASCGFLLCIGPQTPAGQKKPHRSSPDSPPQNPAASWQNHAARSRQAAHSQIRASGCRSPYNISGSPRACCYPMCCARPSRSGKKCGTPRRASLPSGTCSPSPPRRTSGSSPAPALPQKVLRRK